MGSYLGLLGVVWDLVGLGFPLNPLFLPPRPLWFCFEVPWNAFKKPLVTKNFLYFSNLGTRSKVQTSNRILETGNKGGTTVTGF